MQQADSSKDNLFTGIEVYSPGHFGRINIGDLVEVEGIVGEEPKGLTILKMCPDTTPKVLKQNQKVRTARTRKARATPSDGNA